MEILITAAILSYIIYLRYYADFSTKADRERALLAPGIQLYETNQLLEAQRYFDQQLEAHPQWSIAYLYRARCRRELGDLAGALSDLQTGAAYDESVADTHLELGRIRYDEQAYQLAFLAFDKAVFHAQGTSALAYYWRGLARRQLGQATEAQADLNKAAELESTGQVGAVDPRPAAAFFDRRLWINAFLVLLNSLLLLLVVKQSPVIHWPYLLAASSATIIGFAEPRKGWSLALLQSLTLLVGYHFFTEVPTNGGQRTLERFNLYGAVGLTFVGSFIGGILKRAMGR